jgi:2-desacetyl-2-hydroxyethyl bacteriochlorophyllide A dehydrogenase
LKGFVVTGPNQASFTDIEMPAVKPGQALIRVVYSGICGGDPGHVMRNAYGASPEQPRVYGHEYYGEVVSINNPENLPCRVKVGDMVVGPQNAPCGVCDQCMEGRFSICSAQYGAIRRPGGTFGEYLERDLDKLFPIAPGVDPIVAAVAEPLAIAVFDVRNSGIGLGHNALIIGAGAVGMLIGMLARHNGASRIVFSEVSDNRVESIAQLGFEAHNSMKEDILKIVKETTEEGMDYVFEVSGSQAGWDLMFEAAKPGGVVVPVGLPNPNRSINFARVVEKELDMRCVNMHHLNDFSEAVNLINRGDINDELKKIVTSIWPLEETGAALEASTNKDGKDIKILLQPGLKEKQMLA